MNHYSGFQWAEHVQPILFIPPQVRASIERIERSTNPMSEPLTPKEIRAKSRQDVKWDRLYEKLKNYKDKVIIVSNN